MLTVKVVIIMIGSDFPFHLPIHKIDVNEVETSWMHMYGGFADLLDDYLLWTEG